MSSIAFFTTRPRKPSAETSRLLPPPKRKQGSSSACAAWSAATSWACVRAATNQSAGPPTRNVVWWRSRSCSRRRGLGGGRGRALRAGGHEPVRRPADAKRRGVAEQLLLAQALADGRAEPVPDPWSPESHDAQIARAARSGQTTGLARRLRAPVARGRRLALMNRRGSGSMLRARRVGVATYRRFAP